MLEIWWAGKPKIPICYVVKTFSKKCCVSYTYCITSFKNDVSKVCCQYLIIEKIELQNSSRFWLQSNFLKFIRIFIGPHARILAVYNSTEVKPGLYIKKVYIIACIEHITLWLDICSLNFDKIGINHITAYYNYLRQVKMR